MRGGGGGGGGGLDPIAIFRKKAAEGLVLSEKQRGLSARPLPKVCSVEEFHKRENLVRAVGN